MYSFRLARRFLRRAAGEYKVTLFRVQMASCRRQHLAATWNLEPEPGLAIGRDETPPFDEPPAWRLDRAIYGRHRHSEQDIQPHYSVDPLSVVTLVEWFVYVPLTACPLCTPDGQMFEVRTPFLVIVAHLL